MVTIKANELRIGDYVFDCEDYVDKVTAIITPMEENEINFYPWLHGEAAIMLDNFVGPHSVGSIAGVPITEDWLVKFGFEEYKGAYYYPHFAMFLCVCLDPFYVGICRKNDVVLYTRFEYVKYIHQLQNLYFALTGEELAIKDK